jgi:LPS-assembly lipoprotein
MQRRRWLLSAPLLALAGCGFELRRVADLQFQSIALTGFAPRSPLAQDLRAALERTVTVKDSPAQAQVVFQALRDERTRKAVVFTASGQVRDIQLRMLLRYRAQTPSQRELIADADILQIRELTYIESKTLGKEQEEQDLWREMQSDVVLQVMLRLSTVKV